ncbi:MAG: methyltransferase [Synergistaceae bacterium]|nr:methyltransferase [Synergistaceae bacterium]
MTSSRDDILYGILKLWQPRSGARVNVDTVLLAAYPDFTVTRKDKFAELGSASGAVSLLLAKRFVNLHVTGFEIQKEAVELAKLNAVENGLVTQVSFLEFDIRNYRSIEAQSYGGIVVNPPYKSVESGRVSTRSAEAAARQETACRLEDVVFASRWLLRSKGHFYCVFTANRMSELLNLLVNNGLEPKRIRNVHPKPQKTASVFLLEAVKEGGIGLTIEPPLYIYDENGEYTEELKKAYTLDGLPSALRKRSNCHN